jgi:pimeloyl-ACP methyl ester carboxylesterase
MSLPLPLVLIPGAGCTERLWHAQIAGLHTVVDPIVLNVAQHDHISTLVADAVPTLPPRFALAGLSMGGFISLEFMRQAPERVRKLALLDTQAREETLLAKARRPLAILLARLGLVDAVFGLLWRRLVAAERRGDRALKAVVQQMARETGSHGLVNQQKIFLSVRDYRPLLSTIDVPTLVLVGEGDTLTPPDRAVEIARGIPHAHLVRVPHCGHLSTLEAPEAVTAAMRQWLAA